MQSIPSETTWPKRLGFVLLTLTTVLLAGAADDVKGLTKIYNLTPSTHGNPEGIAFDSVTQTFFVSATGDGTIYRGTLGNLAPTVFIAGGPGKEAAGLKVFQGKLYVAGAFSGAVSVYDISTKNLVATFQNFGAGMLNDLVVTQNADVFVTDSFVPVLWHITAAQVSAGTGVPNGIPVAREIQYTSEPDPFNLNGIVALRGGRSFIVAQSNTGRLFRIDLDDSAPYGRTIHQIAVEPLVGADGLLLDGGDLIVVQGGPPGRLAFVRLNGQVDRGTVVERRSDPSFRFPSTIARARNYYLIVNLDIIGNVMPFTVTGLPRNYADDDQ
jgi:sugar lactone lactonase YvrE